LWFNRFTTFYRVKLWNALNFSEDYLMALINGQKNLRKDIAVRMALIYDNLKQEYLDEVAHVVEGLEGQEELTEGERKRLKKEKKIL